MTIDTGDYISDWSAGGGTIDYPEDASLNSEVDDAIRQAKQAIINTFPGVSGEVTSTHSELNLLDGLTEPLSVMQRGKTSAGIATATETGSPVTRYTLTTGATLTLAAGMRLTLPELLPALYARTLVVHQTRPSTFVRGQ